MDKIEEPKNTIADGKYSNCECFCEEQKKQTNLLRKIYQSLQSSFSKFRKTWISFTAIGVIISAYSLYWTMTQPSVAEQMKLALEQYRLEQVVTLPDSMSMYKEVQELYKIRIELERLRLFCSDYQQRFESVTKYTSVTNDNYQKFADDFKALTKFRLTMQSTMDSIYWNVTFNSLFSFDEMASLSIPSYVQDDYIRVKEGSLKKDICLLNYFQEFDSIQDRKSEDGKILEKDMDILCAKLSKRVINTLKDPVYSEYVEQILTQISYQNRMINIRLRGIYSQVLNGNYEAKNDSTVQEIRNQLNNIFHK